MHYRKDTTYFVTRLLYEMWIMKDTSENMLVHQPEGPQLVGNLVGKCNVGQIQLELTFIMM